MAEPTATKTSRSNKTQVFTYEGIDKKNNRLTGEISAPNIQIARTQLQAQNINVLKLQKKSTSMFGKSHSKVKSDEITLFSRQMSTMLSSGIPLVQALLVISEGSPSGALGDLTRKIKLDVESGISFSAALRKNPQYFDTLYCNLVESGEQSGTLDTMLDRIALYLEKSDSLQRKVKKALYYPTAVIIIAGVVTSILLIKVVPTFKEMFTGFGAELPGFTLFVLGISDLLRNYGVYVIISLVAFFFLIRHLYRTKVPFQHLVQRLSLKTPIFGGIIQKTIVARFARTLSTTTAAGVPLTDALESVANASGNIVYQTAIQKVKEGLATGQQMRVVMKKTNVFPNIVVQMIGIGEESGALEAMLGKIATIFEEEVDTAVDGLTTLLEPLIMAILGIVVGGLVVAMYLPIFKMGSIL